MQPLSDQSVFVKSAIEGVAARGADRARASPPPMILLFLGQLARDADHRGRRFRSSVLTALIALAALGRDASTS